MSIVSPTNPLLRLIMFQLCMVHMFSEEYLDVLRLKDEGPHRLLANGKPTFSPTYRPTKTGKPSFKPSPKPSQKPTSQPTRQPSRQPTRQPTSQPSRQPSRQPSSQPSRQPSRQPSSQVSLSLFPSLPSHCRIATLTPHPTPTCGRCPSSAPPNLLCSLS